MKELTLLIIISFFFLCSYSQVTSFTGTTKVKTTVTYGNNKQKKIQALENVTIIDANDNLFTIKYEDGRGYVDQKDIDFKPSDLEALMNTKNSQTVDYIAQIETERVVKEKLDSSKYEIDHIRNCALKYHVQIKTGYVISGLGIVAASLPLIINESDPKTLKIFGFAGAGLGFIGSVILIDSNKWMKHIYAGPNGFGIKYRFH